MPDIVADAKTRVSWLFSCVNPALPTLTELNAGILLHSLLTPDGLIGFAPTTADVPSDALDGEYDTVDVGRITFSGTMLRFKKQSGTDTPYATLVKGATGFIAIRRSIAASTAWASAQALRVFPAKCGETSDLPLEKNTMEKYEVPIKIYQAPNLRAVVA